MFSVTNNNIWGKTVRQQSDPLLCSANVRKGHLLVSKYNHECDSGSPQRKTGHLKRIVVLHVLNAAVSDFRLYVEHQLKLASSVLNTRIGPLSHLLFMIQNMQNFYGTYSMYSMSSWVQSKLLSLGPPVSIALAVLDYDHNSVTNGMKCPTLNLSGS